MSHHEELAREAAQTFRWGADSSTLEATILAAIQRAVAADRQYRPGGDCVSCDTDSAPGVAVLCRRCASEAVAAEKERADRLRLMISCEEGPRECCGPVNPQHPDDKMRYRSQCLSCQVQYHRERADRLEAWLKCSRRAVEHRGSRR